MTAFGSGLIGKAARTMAAGSLAVLMSATAALAGTPVTLKGELVSGERAITLGDLFDGAGRAAAVPVGVAPPTGADAVLDAGQVQHIAHINGLDWDNPTRFRRLVVHGGGAAVSVSAVAPKDARTVEVLTYAHSLAAGQIIQPEDVIWAKVQAHLAPSDAPSDAAQAIGQAAKRPLREGAAVAAHDLSSPVVIKKDQVIQVIYRAEGVELTLQGTALGSAAVGDTLQVLNTQSKKIIEAVATAPGQALTGPAAESLKSRSFASLR